MTEDQIVTLVSSGMVEFVKLVILYWVIRLAIRGEK